MHKGKDVVEGGYVCFYSIRLGWIFNRCRVVSVNTLDLFIFGAFLRVKG